jgi:hypothetical protein
MHIPGIDPYDLALEIARGLYLPDQDNDVSDHAPLVQNQLCLSRTTLRKMNLPVDTYLPLKAGDDSPSAPIAGPVQLSEPEGMGRG